MRASRITRSGSELKDSGPGAAQQLRLQVGHAAVRIDQLATPGQQLSGDGVDREVASTQVLIERLPHQRRQIHLPVLVVRAHAPGAELLGELERVTTGSAAEFSRQPADVAIHGQVEVGGLAAEQSVADGAADEPGATVPGSDLCERGQRAALAGGRLTHTGLPLSR